MDPENEALSGTRLGFKTTGDSREAPESSTDSIEPSRGRRGRKRRVKTAVTSPDAGDSRSCTRRSMRVLRARVSEAGQTSESTNATCKKNPARLLRGRVRHPASRSKNSPVMQTTIKKSTAKKAPKRTFGPKLSKSKKSKGRSPTRMTQNNPITTCKPEAEMKNSSCGQETGTLKGSCDKEKPRQHMEVKKEEEEENGIKEEPTDVVEHTKGRVGDYTEPIRKRGRQPKDDKAPRQPKRRKKPPVQYVRCEMEGCGTVLAHPRYLQHHIKYQHLLKKKYVCDHPSCGRLFRLQKQLLRHAKHHTDQRDYICEYCARAFKSSHNLAVHRMIHTGEKPIQCEICGFTCRQKASLNWHMKKHDAEASYQFSCSICGKKFEKKDSVVAHKAKSHPEVLIAEALAANGAPVISSPTSVPETVPVLTQPDRPSVTQESQEDVSGSLTQLQQVVLPLAPQTQIDVTQGHFLPTHHVVQVAHQQQAPALLHLTTAPPAHLSSSSSNQPQLIQLPTASTVTSMTTVDSQSTLLTLTSVTTLTSPQATQWGREAVEVTQMPVEGELWDRMMVGGGHQDVGEIIWESSRERRKEDEGIVWEREGDKQILLHCAEIPGDNII